MLNVFAEIRPDERRATYWAFFVLFGIMAAHALMETARDALFLARMPPARLAYVYLAIALLSLLTFVWQQRRGLKQDRATLVVWLGLSALVTMGLWAVVGSRDGWILYLLYIWSGLFATLVVVRFWTLLGDLFTVTQAKRLFAFIGAGSVLGAIFGSSLARILTATLEPRHLLLATVALLLMTALLPVMRLPRPDTKAEALAKVEKRPTRQVVRPLRTIWDKPYLRRVSGIILLSTVTFTLVDFLFKNAIAQNVPAHSLAAFFATMYLVLNTLSLFTQLLLVSWLVRRLGVDRVLSVLPLLLALGSVGIVVSGGLLAAVVLKGFDGVLRHSLHRTATEVLYVPLTGELRARVKGLIDVVGQRGGQAFASLCILVAVALGKPELILGLAVLMLTIAWMRVTGSLGTHYLSLFREALGGVSVQTRADFPELDLASLETLMTSLNSANDAEVVAALEFLAEQDRVHLIPALILYHPSSRVVLRALDLFTASGRTDFVSITERLLEHSDPEVRAAALRTRTWVVAPSIATYERFIRDLSPIVRATALVGLASYGRTPDEYQARLETLAEGGSMQEKLALARAIRYSPGAAYEGVLLKLADCEHVEVRRAVTLAMREILSARFIPKLLAMLPSQNLRNDARLTLVAIGDEALTALDNRLGNRNCDRAVRRQIPRVISSFEPTRAAQILLRHLTEESDGGVRYRILRALGRMRAMDASLPLDEQILQDGVRETLGNVFELMHWRLQVVQGSNQDRSRATEVQELILALLHHKERLALERLFRLLGLLYPDEKDMRSLYRAVRSGDRDLRASSREILEHLLKPPVRDPILALTDDIEDREKLRQAGPDYSAQALEYTELLDLLLDRGGVGMRCLVAYHVGELRLHGLREKLEMLPSDLDGLVSRAVDRALAALAQSQAEGQVLDGS